MDNNILLDRPWFFKVCDFCIQRDLKVWFTQGLDIRLLDDSVAVKLSELKVFNGFHFAFDDTNLEPVIRAKCEILKNHGIDIRNEVQFYVYLDSNDKYDDAVHRCRVLKHLNTNAFVQFNINNKSNKKVNELRRWANRKWIYWSCDIKDYTRSK